MHIFSLRVFNDAAGSNQDEYYSLCQHFPRVCVWVMFSHCQKFSDTYSITERKRCQSSLHSAAYTRISHSQLTLYHQQWNILDEFFFACSCSSYFKFHNFLLFFFRKNLTHKSFVLAVFVAIVVTASAAGAASASASVCKRTLSNILRCMSCEFSMDANTVWCMCLCLCVSVSVCVLCMCLCMCAGTWKNINSYIRLTST